MRKPVTIVGAGPAGMTAAIVLRRHGVPVRVYEKYPNAGYRLNGDFQGFENWSTEQDVTDILKEIGIDPRFFALLPYYGGTVYAPGMSAVTVTSKRPIFYLVRRGATPGSLDHGLREQAEAIGVEFVFNHRVKDFERVSIVGTGAVGADALAVGMTFETSHDDTAAVAFNNDLANGGYAYLLVHEGRGTMASVLYGSGFGNKEAFGRMVEFFRRELSLVFHNERHFSGYASFFLRDSQVVRNRLYVGESAGFQDCLWGFGMRYAVMSGYLAASSILNRVDYDRLWKQRLLPMLETSLVNRFLIELFGTTAYRYLACRVASGDPCAFLRRHYNRSFGKRLILPVAKRVFSERFHLREIVSS